MRQLWKSQLVPPSGWGWIDVLPRWHGLTCILAKLPVDVLAAVKHVQNLHVLILDVIVRDDARRQGAPGRPALRPRPVPAWMPG